MNSPALDPAVLSVVPPQRRAALLAIAALGAITLVAVPFARVVLGTFPGFVTLYGGAVFMGLAITATIVFAQFALLRRPSLLLLACGTLFSAIVFVPYILTFPGAGMPQVLGSHTTTSVLFWIVWHSMYPAALVAYAVVAARERGRLTGSTAAIAAIGGTLVAAYAVLLVIFSVDDLVPALISPSGVYYVPVYATLVLDAAFAALALVLLTRRTHSVFDVWLAVPAAAIVLESLINGLGGTRYSVGWYLSRLDLLIATACLVIALLFETNRLSRILARGEQRLRGIVNGVSDALVIVDLRGAIVSVNPAGGALFGFEADAVAGMPIAQLFPEFAAVEQAPETTIVETLGRDVRGRLFPIELTRGRDATRALGETILIVRDITQRKAADEAIRAAHDRAIEAADVKSQFLATVSHEIRTPINAVVGMSELLMETQLDDEAREYVTTVRDSAESLLAIVNDILDFSKIEAGRMELDAMPFSPLVAVENATDILAAAARKKGLALFTFVAADVPRCVVGDADRIRQVLLNLVGNAVKFTAAGSVTVRAVVEQVEGSSAVLRFSVADTGPGIAPDVAERLFEPFRQADQSTRRRYGGTGLGLSISRRIVELMGGRIGFDSSFGRGSTFWFTAPFPCVVEENGGDVPTAPPRLPELPLALPPRDAMLVLVAEDNPVNRTLALRQLQKLGYAARAVADGREAVDAVAHGGYDLILMDCQMPNVDGFEATREIRRAEVLRGGHIPIVAMTANALAGDREECLAAGMDDYLAKPVQMRALRAVVERFVNGIGVAG